jgi:copper transporter 1
MMHMTFYWGIGATLLFDQWVTKTVFQYLLSLVAIFLFGILHEYFYNLRVVLNSKKSGPPTRHHLDSENTVPFLEKAHVPPGKAKDFLVVLLYGVNAGTGYLLMLLVMSFNGGVFLAVVLGLLVGFALFRSHVASESFNSSDVCHAS